MINKINFLFVTLFGIGKIKKIPGSVASLATISFLFFLFHVLNFSPDIVLFLIVIIFFYSFHAINNSFNEFKSEDPQEIVIDEFVGQMLTLLAIPIYETLYPLPIIYYCVAAFLLFRLFDIWKPYPISYIDDNTSGPLGIMLDDIIASIYSIIILILIFFFFGG